MLKQVRALDELISLTLFFSFFLFLTGFCGVDFDCSLTEISSRCSRCSQNFRQEATLKPAFHSFYVSGAKREHDVDLLHTGCSQSIHT